jgi:hypothetical protein
MNKDDFSAFPYSIRDDGTPTITEMGMSMRDYFAAKALPSILTLEGNSTEENDDPYGFAKSVAHMSYVIADAMLEERSKE